MSPYALPLPTSLHIPKTAPLWHPKALRLASFASPYAERARHHQRSCLVVYLYFLYRYNTTSVPHIVFARPIRRSAVFVLSSFLKLCAVLNRLCKLEKQHVKGKVYCTVQSQQLQRAARVSRSSDLTPLSSDERIQMCSDCELLNTVPPKTRTNTIPARLCKHTQREMNTNAADPTCKAMVTRG